MPLPFEIVHRSVIVKRTEKTDPAFGCAPEERPVERLLKYGVLTLNKPKGPTSHQCSDYVQKILGIGKAGHGGTLDPAVTGVLPVALQDATRIVQALLPAGKEYVCIMHLHKDVEEAEVRRCCAAFVGRIQQMVPRKAAVVRRLRERTIYYLNILEIDGKEVLFAAGVEAGTYIRKLCHDIGKQLGCGAHMAELVRTKAGPFNALKWVTLQELEDAAWYWREEHNDRLIRKCVFPVETAIPHIPKVWVLDSAVESLCHGAPLHVPGVAKFETGIETGVTVAIMSLKDELIALGLASMTSDQLKKEERGCAVRPQKVFMEPGTYKGAN